MCHSRGSGGPVPDLAVPRREESGAGPLFFPLVRRRRHADRPRRQEHRGSRANSGHRAARSARDDQPGCPRGKDRARPIYRSTRRGRPADPLDQLPRRGYVRLAPSGEGGNVDADFALAQGDRAGELVVPVGHVQMRPARGRMGGARRRGAFVPRAAAEVSGVTFHTRQGPRASVLLGKRAINRHLARIWRLLDNLG